MELTLSKYSCWNCKTEYLSQIDANMQRCPRCGYVVNQKENTQSEHHHYDGVLPLLTTREQARQAIIEENKKGYFRNGILKHKPQDHELEPVYIPVMFFQDTVLITHTAKNNPKEPYHHSEVRFNNMPFTASQILSGKVLKMAEPIYPTNPLTNESDADTAILIENCPNSESAQEKGQQRMTEAVQNHLKKHSRLKGEINMRCTSNPNFKNCKEYLLPVWIYHHEGLLNKSIFAVNGVSGKISPATESATWQIITWLIIWFAVSTAILTYIFN